MASKSQTGRQTKFSIGAQTGSSSGTETFTKVGEVMQCSMSGITVDLEDVSSFDTVFIKDKLGNLADGGTVDLKFNYVAGGTDAGQAAINSALRTGLPFDFTIELPRNTRLSTPQTTKGDSFAFSAIVSKGGALDIGVKGPITGSAGLTIVSDIVLTPGT